MYGTQERSNRMLFHIYVSTYSIRGIRICEYIPRLSNRSLDAMRDSSRESSFYSEYYYICIYTCMYADFFPRICGRFSSSWHANRSEKKKKKEGKGKTYFDMRNSGECHLPPAIFDNCQRQRNAPSPRPPV